MMEFKSWYAWWIVAALDGYALVRLITRSRRNVHATLAWFFAILAIPYGGALAYLVLGNPNVRRIGRQRRAVGESVRRMFQRLKAVPGDLEGLAGHAGGQSLLVMVASLTGIPPFRGNRVELLTPNVTAMKTILDALRKAERSIWVEFYIIRNDATGWEFLEILAAKAKAGIEVRLLYDGIGSLGLDAKRLAAITAAGGHCEAFLPFNVLKRRWATHLRNHRRIIVVDGRVGYVGSLNVGDEYSGSARRMVGERFRDTHLELEGPAVEGIAQIFSEDWLFATEELLTWEAPRIKEQGNGSLVALVPSGPHQEHNAHALAYFSGITCALKKCYITSPYFIPDEPMLQALLSASWRGVDVRLLLPYRSDVKLVAAAARSYYAVLIRAGVRIFEYERAILHSKTVVVDGLWGLVGSANMDIRSFDYNFEIGALVWDPHFAARLEKDFLRDQVVSREITLEDIHRRTFSTRLGLGVVRLLSPLL